MSFLKAVLSSVIVVSTGFLTFSLFNLPETYRNKLKAQKIKIESYREIIKNNKNLTDVEREELNHLINDYCLNYDNLKI